MRDRIEQLFKNYEEPEFDKEGKFITKRIKRMMEQADQEGDNIDQVDINVAEDQEMMDDLRKEIELSEGTLVTNLFIPTAIICSKVDLIEHGEKHIKELLERNLDYIQVSLRKFCLHYGSSLVFASSNSNSNISLIYDYFLSRLYNHEFPHPSNMSDKEALFIPTGMDTLDMIEKQSDMKSFLAKI